MVRVDVFRKQNKRGAWEFFLVPIYPHQVADKINFKDPPNRAVQAYKDESEWPVMDSTCEYLWPLYQLSYVELVTGKGKPIAGYYRGTHRGTGAINITYDHSKEEGEDGIGARTLKSIRKFSVDRLGNRHEIQRETRTWRGVACI